MEPTFANAVEREEEEEGSELKQIPLIIHCVRLGYFSVSMNFKRIWLGYKSTLLLNG